MVVAEVADVLYSLAVVVSPPDSRDQLEHSFSSDSLHGLPCRTQSIMKTILMRMMTKKKMNSYLNEQVLTLTKTDVPTQLREKRRSSTRDQAKMKSHHTKQIVKPRISKVPTKKNQYLGGGRRPL